jgi:hypothetical protein
LPVGPDPNGVFDGRMRERRLSREALGPSPAKSPALRNNALEVVSH